SPETVRFQTAVLLVDLAIIAFFIATPPLRVKAGFYVLDYCAAALLIPDLAARGLAATDPLRWLRQPTVIVDLVILATLLLPAWLANFGFLRILRLWTMSKSGFLLRPIRKYGLGDYQEPIRAVVNLLTFLFVVT